MWPRRRFTEEGRNETGRGSPVFRDRGGVGQFGGSYNDNRGVDRDYDARSGGDFGDSRRDFGYDGDNRNRDLQFPSTSPIYQEHIDYPFLKDDSFGSHVNIRSDRFEDNVLGRHGQLEERNQGRNFNEGENDGRFSRAGTHHNKDNNRNRGRSPNFGNNQNQPNRQSRGFNSRNRGGFTNKGTRNSNFQEGNRRFVDRSLPTNNSNSINRVSTVSKVENNPKSCDSRFGNRNKQSANDRNSSKSSHGRGSDRSRTGQSSHTNTSHSQGNRSHSSADRSNVKKSSPRNSSQSTGRERSPRSGSSRTADSQKRDDSKKTSRDRSPRSRSATGYNDHRNDNTKSRDTDLTNDQSFKKPKELSRNDAMPKSESSFINTSYHEDDIISIMADDEGFDRETIRTESVISVNRQRTHAADRQGDSRKVSQDRSDRSLQRDSSRTSRNRTDNKKVTDKSSASGRKPTEHRGSERRDNDRVKNNPRVDRRTQVFASKIRKRTMFGFQRSDNRQFGEMVSSNSRSKGTDRPLGGKYDFKSKLFRNSTRQGNNMTKFRDDRIGSERANAGAGSDRQEGVQIRGRSGAILKDDRDIGPTNRVNDNQNIQGFTNAATNFDNNFDNGKFRYIDKRGKFDRPKFNTGKSNAVLRESIKKRYDRVRHKIKNRMHYEQRKERQMTRNINFKEEGTSQLDKQGEGIMLSTDQPMIDGAQPIYFIPHSDMGVGQPQFIDPMGNIVANPAMGIPAGDNLQLLPQGLPLPDGGTGDQQIVFIPFPPQMPAMPENSIPSPDPNMLSSNAPQATKRGPQEKSTEQAGKKPLSAHARMLIRKNLMKKKRMALEKKIEKQVLKKLMSNSTISGMKKEPSPVKKRPVIKRISPPRETSHINKKVKLVHRSAPKEVLDDVSDDYDNVSEFEDVSDMEDVSDDETEDHYGGKRRAREQLKRPGFRKPVQPKLRNDASSSGDVRRVVNQSSRNSSASRRMTDDARKKDVTSECHQTPTYARKRRSISPIEITVSNVRKQDFNQQGSNIQGPMISRFQDDDDEEGEDVNESYVKSSAAARARGRYGGESEVSKNRRGIGVERRSSSGKYEDEEMDRHSRDRSRERSQENPSRRQRIAQDRQDRDTRSRGSAQDERYDDNDQRQRPHLVSDDFTDNRQITTSFVGSQKYTSLSSQSFTGQNPSPIVIYSNSDVDYSLPPQQMSQMSGPLGPSIVDLHNAKDMSMPPPMVGGPPTSMSPLMIHQQPMHNLDNARFTQQQQQPQYRQQHVVQHQTNSPSMRIIHQGQPTQQGVMRGRQQIQHSTHALYTDTPQTIQSSPHVKLVHGSPMMGPNQQTIQSSRSPQYVSRAPQQPGIVRGKGFRSRFSPQSETQGIRNNRPLMHTVGNRGRYMGNVSETSGRYTGASNQYTMMGDTGSGFVEDYEDDMAELLCSKCDRVFLDDKAMRKHKEWHDKVAMGDCQLRCDLCEQAFPSTAQSQIHDQEKHSVDSWNCNMCDLTFHTASVLEQHLNSLNHHSTKLLYNCSICPASFQALKFLIQHKRDHHSGQRDVAYY